MNRQFLSNILIGLCFAVPAITFSWAVTRTVSNLWWFSVPIAAGLSSAVLSILIWKFIALESDNIAVDMLCGASVGVLSHPLAAILSVFVAISLSAAGFMPNESVRPLPDPSILKAVGFIVFWWCLSALCGVGWVTIVIGGIVGQIIGGCRLYFQTYSAEADCYQNRYSRRTPQSKVVGFGSRNSPLSNAAALLIVSFLTGGLFALDVSVEPERIPEFLIEEDAQEV